jgi:glycosyltransferase involved in cell wall biosynthesis
MEPLLIITYEELSSHNGLNTRMRGIARALAAGGRRVEIAVPIYGKRAPANPTELDGIRVHTIPVPDLFARWHLPIVTRALSVVCLTACMVRYFRSRGSRYAWVQAEQIYPFMAAYLLAGRWRARVILDDPSLLGLFVEEKLRRRRILRPLLRRCVDAFENMLFRRADRILCSSDRQAVEVSERIRGAKARVHRLCNGVDPEEFAFMPDGESGNRIFFNGSVPYYQNVAALRNLLKIFVYFEEQAFHDYSAVVVVNDAKGLAPDLVSAIESNPQVRLLSNQRSIVPWLHGCDLVLLPYETGHRTTAGPRLKVFEALSCGKILLSTKEGLDEVDGCADGQNVIVCSDWLDMAHKTMALIKEGQTARKRRMQAEARLLIEAEYSWQSLAKVYESILEVA